MHIDNKDRLEKPQLNLLHYINQANTEPKPVRTPTRLKAIKKFDFGGIIVPEKDRIDRLRDQFDDKTLKQIGVIECQTCSNRVYQDKSDDPSVSFQTPTHLSPSEAMSAVVSHENEHVVNEQARARKEGKEVVSQSVQIFMSICPECGTSYVSGGVTKTTVRGNRDKSHIEYGLKKMTEGNLVDYKL